MKFMIRVLCSMIFFIPLMVEAQGIKWTENQSWSQILQKALQENKYIFVDCYATWCIPCKEMDKNVYLDEKVGEALNEKFISIKLQIDRTNNDGQEVKALYPDAKLIEEKYKIDAFPTLLFFSPNGELVHRFSAGMNIEAFLNLVNSALDPKKQYYTRLNEYKKGKRDTSVLVYLATASLKLGDKNLAGEIANHYISTLKPENLYKKEIKEFVTSFSTTIHAKKIASAYIKNLKNKEIYTKDNIEFIRSFIGSVNDRGFKIFYNHPEKINSVMNLVIPETWDKDDYAQDAIRSVLYSEYFLKPIFKPALSLNSKSKPPSWVKLKTDILKKYPKVDAERVVIDAKYIWYRWAKSPEYFSSILDRMNVLYKDKNLSFKYFEINNFCWELFENTKDPAILNRAILWMEQMFEQSADGRQFPNALDTYANLLYKVGRKGEALEWQEKALKADPTDDNIKETLSKMKNGMPTWPQN